MAEIFDEERAFYEGVDEVIGNIDPGQLEYEPGMDADEAPLETEQAPQEQRLNETPKDQRPSAPRATKAPDPGGCGLCIAGEVTRKNPRFPNLAPVQERCTCALGAGIVLAAQAGVVPAAPPPVVEGELAAVPPAVEGSQAIGPAVALRMMERDARALEGELVDQIIALETAGTIKAGERRKRVTAWQNPIRRPALVRCPRCSEFLVYSGAVCGGCGKSLYAAPIEGLFTRKGIGGFAMLEGREVQLNAVRGTPTWLEWARDLGRQLLAGAIPKKPGAPVAPPVDDGPTETRTAAERARAAWGVEPIE